MAKKTKKKKPAKKAPSVQKTLVDLCEMVNTLIEHVADLQFEIGTLREADEAEFSKKLEAALGPMPKPGKTKIWIRKVLW